jgi:hypothetical protein
MTVFKMKTVAILLWSAFLSIAEVGFGQQVGMIGDWRDAVKLLDSSSDEDAGRAEHLLRLELGKPNTPVQAAIGLGIFCIKRGDAAALDKVLSGIKLKFPQLPPHVVAAVHRMQAWSDLANKRDQERVQESFQALIQGFKDDTLLDSQYVTAFFVGSCFGTIDNELGGETIEPARLHPWKQDFSEHEISAIRSAFTQGYETSRSKVSRFLSRLEELKKLGIEQAKAMHTQAESQLETDKAGLSADREAVNQLEKSNDSRIKERSNDRKRIESTLARLNREWKVQTPGHPGVEKPPPIVPNRLDIYIEPFITYLEWVVDSSGNRVQVPRTVQKSYHQIESERDERYRTILAEYRIIRAEYDQYINRYRRDVAAWTKNDADRRQKLQTSKGEAEQALQVIRQETEKLRSESDEATKLLSLRSADLRRRQTEFMLDQRIIPAIETGRITDLVDPKLFELFHFAREKKLLLDTH